MLKTPQKNGANTLTSNIKRIMKNYARVIRRNTNRAATLGPQDAYYIPGGYRGDGFDMLRHKLQNDLKSSINNRT